MDAAYEGGGSCCSNGPSSLRGMAVVAMAIGAITLVVVCCLLRRRVDLAAAVPMQKAMQHTTVRTIAIGMDMARNITIMLNPIINPKRSTAKGRETNKVIASYVGVAYS